jgi:hypothetical protein
MENYGDKPPGEQKALFISAVRTWEELRDEYPEWKARKDEKDRAAEQEVAEQQNPLPEGGLMKMFLDRKRENNIGGYDETKDDQRGYHQEI